MAIPAIQMNYPLTTLHFTDAGASVTDILAASITTPLVVPVAIQDGAAATGSAGQYLTAGAGDALLWADLPAAVTPSLAEVMAVATAGDAGGQGLSNTPSVGLFDTSGGVVLSAVPATSYLNISTNADVSGATREFSRAYLPISVAGTVYYLPLFSAV